MYAVVTYTMDMHKQLPRIDAMLQTYGELGSGRFVCQRDLYLVTGAR